MEKLIKVGWKGFLGKYYIKIYAKQFQFLDKLEIVKKELFTRINEVKEIVFTELNLPFEKLDIDYSSFF